MYRNSLLTSSTVMDQCKFDSYHPRQLKIKWDVKPSLMCSLKVRRFINEHFNQNSYEPNLIELDKNYLSVWVSNFNSYFSLTQSQP